MQARSATLPDAMSIEQLIQVHVADGTLLPRSLAEICENIRDFVVVEHDGEIVGCGALHLYGMHLAEIRSITVTAKAKGTGAGRVLVDALLKEAQRQSVTCICLFTRIPDFFGRMGFRIVEKEALPDKMYKDCLKCPRLYACDETAMYLGTLPKHAPNAVSARSAPKFVQIASPGPVNQLRVETICGE
jgi:amino-acid N-acetyltransferase